MDVKRVIGLNDATKIRDHRKIGVVGERKLVRVSYARRVSSGRKLGMKGE
jgi:hypothetical protein